MLVLRDVIQNNIFIITFLVFERHIHAIMHYIMQCDKSRQSKLIYIEGEL